MKKQFLKIIIFIILVVIATVYPFYCTNLYSYDEVWNFGFAKSILDGLIPYKDFSLIVPPIFPYLTSIIIKIFGEKLFVYYAFIAIISTSITYLASKKIGFYSILIYISLLIYSSNGYNTFSLLLLFILLLIIDKKIKYQDIIIAILISIMVCTKQTLALLIIPSIIYSKNKKKTILTYIICFLICLTYFLINNTLLQFLNYCLFGMFEFTEKNRLSIPVYLILEIIICIILIINLIKSKGKRKDIFYILLYQIVAFPITDISHFVLAWSPNIFLLFQKTDMTKFARRSFLTVILTAEIGVLLISNYTTTIHNKIYIGYSQEKTFLEGKLVPSVTGSYIEEISKTIKKHPDRKLYLLGSNSYLIKLFLDIPITKYDLINEGNMGYNGSEKYIQEIKKTCEKEECLFIINNNELTKNEYGQTNPDILQFVDKEYKKIYSTNVYGVYIN